MDVIVRCTLRDRRLAKNLTLRDLQELSGINRGTISRYETGKQNMSIKTAAMFALLLNCKLDDLFTYEPVAGED